MSLSEVTKPGPGAKGPRVYSDPNATISQTYPKFLIVVATVATLYFGRDIFLPLAVAVLLTFALAPVVGWLRKLWIPRPIAVVSVVLAAFASIFLFGAIVVSQLGTLASNLPAYQTNIESKVRALKDANVGTGIFSRLTNILDRLGRQIEEDSGASIDDPAAADTEARVDPLPVEVIEPAPQPLKVLQTIIGPLIQPIATGGIIVVVVIFMLLRREDLRDRFIRLVGAGDLHRTTAALQDAGRRVGQYLLMQLVVNITYAVPIGIGLWLIGVPNAPLWGLLALVLRFVPYIGPIIASILPLILALAVDPGWTMVVWTAALFIALELISNNVVEPWLYGSRTGLSSLAIIVSAIFWTWLWGPLGLLLSTPLTVCLVVLGRHVPQFEFLDVLLGSDPVLEPHEQLYQRLLAGDPYEATDRAETFLKDGDLITFYQTVAIPALALGEMDRARGVMEDEKRKRVADSATALVDNLDAFAEEEASEEDEDAGDRGDDEPVIGEADENEDAPELPDGAGKTILCAGGRGELDDAAAAMLAQVLTVHGAAGSAMEHQLLKPSRITGLELSDLHAVVISFLNADSVTYARYMVRRLKRSQGSIRVGVVFWTLSDDEAKRVALVATINCDFVARTMIEAVEGALSDEPVVRVKPTPNRLANSNTNWRRKNKIVSQPG